MNEFFPPSQEELQERIKELKKQLENEKYRQHWVYINAEMQTLQKQLNDLLKFNSNQL